MKSKRVVFPGILLLLLVTILLGCKFNPGNNIPKGWNLSGSNPEAYEVGIEKGAGYNNSNAVFIKSTKSDIKGFGTLMQSFSAEKYLGKRIRLSGYIKSKDVAFSSGFWVRIDAKDDPKKQLGFDNMGNRPVKGTTEWKSYQIVLDVPENSGLISLGALIAGTGEIWFSDLKFEVVDKSIPTTNTLVLPKAVEPVNLDFKE